jgi:hypothetical protein
MKRLVLLPVLCLSIQGCAIVNMPDSEAANPAWVEHRLSESGTPRTAPETVPDPPNMASATRELESGEQRILEMQAELEAAHGAEIERDTEAFAAEGQARTTPPDTH